MGRDPQPFSLWPNAKEWLYPKDGEEEFLPTVCERVPGEESTTSPGHLKNAYKLEICLELFPL